jgi:3-methyladenine DNA glycosylase AlkD
LNKIQILQEHLDSAASLHSKEWFENYLKHVIQFRGVKAPKVIEILYRWYESEKIFNLTAQEQFFLACTLIREVQAEDKFSGILLIEKYLIDKIDFEIASEHINKLFIEGAFTNWSTTDSMNVRVLSPLILRHGNKAVSEFSSWAKSDNLWQQRSSIVSLRACINSPEFFPTIRKVISQLSKSKERFIQTGIGWLIADLSKKHPTEAESLVDDNFERLSTEVLRRHTKYLKSHKKYLERRRRQN